MTRPAPLPLDAVARVHPVQRLRRIDPTQAALETALSRPVEPLEIALPEGSVPMSLAPARAADAADPWLWLRLGGAVACMQLPWSLAARIAGQPVEGGDAADAALAIEDALAAPLDAAEAALGLSLRLERLARDLTPDLAPDLTPDLAPDLPVSRTLRIGPRALPLRLSSGAAALLADALATRPLRLLDPVDLPLPIALVLGRTRLTRGELASLSPGDALLLPEGSAVPQAIVVGHLTAPAVPCPGGVRMTAPFQPLPDPDTEAPPMQTDPTQPLIDDIEVQLTFVAGQALVPLRDLRAMAPGTVVPLPLPADASVRIVAGGRTIGTGELIDVGGARAVQIRTLFADE